MIEESIRYIKIPKLDSNDNDISATLNNLTTIIVPLNSTSETKQFNVLARTEFETYYLFNVTADDQDIPTGDKTKIEEYIFSGSMNTGSFEVIKAFNSILYVNMPVQTVIEDNLNFSGDGIYLPDMDIFNPSITGSSVVIENVYNINTLPQKDLTAKLQGFVSCQNPNGGLSISIRRYQSDGLPYPGDIAVFTTSDTATLPIDISGTIPAADITPGDYIAVQLKLEAPQFSGFRKAQFHSGTKLLIGSSVTPQNDTVIIVEPYLVERFQGTNCDVLQGMVLGERPNPFLQDIDYSTSQNIPVNVEALISGSATRATVPESFYTQKSSIIPRYLGTKNQSRKINIWNSSSFNIGNYGNTSPIEVDNINIFEFAWGGGTTPEILGWGGMKMSNILQVNTTSSVRIINKTKEAELKLYDDYRYQSTSYPVMEQYRKTSDLGPDVSIRTISQSGNPLFVWQVSQSRGEFYTTLNNVVPANTNIQIGSYGINQSPTPIIPVSTKIAALGFSVPSKSNFMITSSYDQGPTSSQLSYDDNGNLITNDYLVPLLSGSWATVRSSQPHLMITTWNSNISRVKRNQDGFYQAGSFVKLTYKKFLNQINADLTNGDRWFITIFQELESAGTTGDLDDALLTGSTLVPFNVGYDEKDENGNYPYPLASKGVYEIVGTDPSFNPVYDMDPVFLIIHPPIKFVVPSSSFFCVPDGLPPFPSNATTCGSNTYKVYETNALGPYKQINIGKSESTTNNQHPGSPTNGLGMLMWKAVGKGQLTGEDYVLIQDEISGVGQGYFSTEFLPEEINDNIIQITKEFGSNKT